ncbi:ATP-dependent zinc metalloprotease FtsH [Halorhodospira halochloris]|uniref:ATP-dependent zinc metalloprotease FtsH n=1 Tax=Halorhodospira halochloris TaxID=1052 RepID=UPI001EE866E7|nr:ATP-dependent zinc metalloprotease FtsH [Halorhodospira halochloris]MCG5548465.1 ATP-dependent zinc metalloprotease FtsH [Halorhodospira halochloris]
MAKNLILWVIIAVVLMSVFSNFQERTTEVTEEVAYSEFLDEVERGNVREVMIQGDKITIQHADGQEYKTYNPETDNRALIGELLEHRVRIDAKEADGDNMMLQILISWTPFLLLIAVWIYFMRQMQGGGGGRGAMSFGKSKAKMMTEEQSKHTFNDVAGCDEAKEDVKELVDFLRDPSKFQKLGGTIPRGVLMVGPPGTGKTLLAKAIAGEARVPFFSISGSDFVEMFVGVGASRVRDMFQQAKKQAPCIIFIDELDAVGRQRGAGLGGGHDEREQTLNQMLVEMDGFEGNEGIIVIAATNRPDVLDPALLRPGRFDRQVVVPLPDVRGREQILNVHMKQVPVADDVKAEIIARGTPGFSGADLHNLVNEAALFAARGNKEQVEQIDFEQAKDKIMMGSERKSMVMKEEEKKLTAYHEAGHAIVGLSSPDHDPVHKVSIIPRGRALGVTMFLPEEDRYSYTKQRLDSMIASLFGGRIAEELIFGADKVTTGAQNDIQRATEIARNMVTKWGLSARLGPLAYGEEQGEVFLGHSVAQHKEVSDETQHAIDEEVRAVIDNNYTTAERILREKMDRLHLMAEALMKYETIDHLQIEDIMNGEEPRQPKGWDDHQDDEGDSTAEGEKDTSQNGAGGHEEGDQGGSGPLGRPVGEH